MNLVFVTNVICMQVPIIRVGRQYGTANHDVKRHVLMVRELTTMSCLRLIVY